MSSANVFDVDGWDREFGAVRGSRLPAGTRQMSRGAVVGFPAGPDGAHRLRNTRREGALPGTIFAMRGPDDGVAFPAGSDADFGDLPRKALEADSP